MGSKPQSRRWLSRCDRGPAYNDYLAGERTSRHLAAFTRIVRAGYSGSADIR